MARIRTVKPEFWTSEQVASCSRDARLLFIGMWNFCDDRGVHPVSYRQLKMEVFPGDDLAIDKIQDLCSELEDAGLLSLFEHGERTYWLVTGWRHQKIERPTYKHPDPKTGKFIDSSPSAHRGITPGLDGIGGESIGVDGGCFASCSEPSEDGRSEPETEPGPSAKPVDVASADRKSATDRKPTAVDVPEAVDPPVLVFPCVGQSGKAWPLFQTKINEYAEAYPGIDVYAECRKALQWLRDNSQRQKTFRGMSKFLNGWLGRAQDRSRGGPRSKSTLDDLREKARQRDIEKGRREPG